MQTPPNGILPIIHKLRILHKDIYCTSEKFSKRDKLGIHGTIETVSIDMLSLAIEAAFKSRHQKQTTLESLRLKVEILKHLIRTECELKIINERTYLRLSEQMVEISKMTNGWLNFITQKDSSA
ncbi:MAG: four helix bundle protein [Patescibacteria group bacterium]